MGMAVGMEGTWLVPGLTVTAVAEERGIIDDEREHFCRDGIFDFDGQVMAGSAIEYP
jgi:hypothetical protein